MPDSTEPVTKKYVFSPRELPVPTSERLPEITVRARIFVPYRTVRTVPEEVIHQRIMSAVDSEQDPHHVYWVELPLNSDVCNLWKSKVLTRVHPQNVRFQNVRFQNVRNIISESHFCWALLENKLLFCVVDSDSLNPDPGVWWPKIEKKIQLRKKKVYLIPRYP